MSKKEMRYSQNHIWVQLKRTVVAIGVTDFYLNEIGDLIDLSLPKVGDEIISDISYGEIESMSVLADLVAPVSGGVVKVNTELASKLKLLQKDPFGDGWFLKVRVNDASQLDNLMDEDEYEDFKKSFKKKRKKS